MLPALLTSAVLLVGLLAGLVGGSVGSAATAAGHPSHAGRGAADRITIATFNLLGDSHTRRGGNKSGHGWAQSPVRTARAVHALEHHGVDVAGLQEFQAPQQRALRRAAGRTYAFSSGPHDTDNAVLWRRAQFRLVSTQMVSIPYFGGHEKAMPVVKLADRASGRKFFVASFHNPADAHGPAGRWRVIAAGRERALVSRLRATGLPVFVTGDMNERSPYFCALTSGTDMRSAFGGSHRGGACRPPAYDGIDWIFGNRFVSFSHPVRDRSKLVRSATDHPLVVAQARVR